MPAQKQINLLPQDPFEQSFVGKFLKWALSVGRYIVIGTELVVIGSFLTRFSLDRQMTDLNEAIAQKQAILASYGNLENEVRSIQNRLNLVAEVTKNQLSSQKTLTQISSFTPLDVTYKSIIFATDKIKLSGMAFSEAGLQTLMAKLKSDKNFSKVEVKNLASETEVIESVGFNVEITLAGAKTTKPKPATTGTQQTEGEMGL